MKFVNHLMSHPHNVANQEVPQSFFLLCADSTMRLVTVAGADSPGAIDRGVRSLVAKGTPDGQKIVAVVLFAEAWSNDDPMVHARMERGEVLNLEGLPGTFDVINLVLDSPNVQGMWTNRLVGTMPNRCLSEWEEMRDMRFKRFANYYPASRN